MSPRILMLGASWLQTPPIEYARSMGYHVITCDNRPDNPGHALANESFDVSTTDREGVLALAKDQNVDAVLAYASDPSVPAAAFAAAALGLPGNPPTSVDLLTHKHRYRAFLRDNDFLTPPFRSATSIEEARRELAQLTLPVIAKPVDSSGSKGVLRIDHLDELPAAFRRSLEFSRSGRVILEEYFARVGHQVTGDGFIVDGKLAFLCLAHEHYNRALSQIVPVGESFPWQATNTKETSRGVAKIRTEVERLIRLLDLRVGAFNVEVRFNAKGDVHLLEFGPRNGGNWMPEAIRAATGVDLISYSVEAALGNDCSQLKQVEPQAAIATYMLHAEQEGRFDRVVIDDRLRAEVLQQTILVQTGDPVDRFSGSHGTLGALLLRFQSTEEMVAKMDRMRDYVSVVVY